ncbi:MAG: hypothetical protein QME71_07720 [Dehalococcoidia bacterium]|nr:hypothetical protein [Dehalococcoidia bacterium]
MRRSYLVVLAAILLAALWAFSASAGGSITRPVQPVGIFEGDQGTSTTALGQWTDAYSFTPETVSFGKRTDSYATYSHGMLGSPDIAVNDGDPLGDFLTGVDLFCNSASPAEWDAVAAPGTSCCTPYTFDEGSTDIIAAGKEYLVARGAIFPMSARFTTDITHIWLAKTTAYPLPNPLPLEILTMQLPWHPGTGASMVWTGGGPEPPTNTCSQGGGEAKSHTMGTWTTPVGMTGTPPLRGDGAAPCDTGVYECSDKQVRGWWASPNLVSGDSTVNVVKRVVNTGPEAGDFKDVWHVEAPAGVAATWGGSVDQKHWNGTAWVDDSDPAVAGGGTAQISFSEDNLAVATAIEYTGTLNIDCQATGDYIVAIKDVAYPKAGTFDSDLESNVAGFAIRVNCSSTASSVDKQVITLEGAPVSYGGSSSLNPPITTDGRSVADQVQLLLNDTATVKMTALLRNYSHTNGASSDVYLVAEAPDLDGGGTYDITVNFDNTSVAAVYGSDPDTNAPLTPTSVSCIAGGGSACAGLKVGLNEPNGPQIALTAELDITCPATEGTYLVPIKAVEVPVGNADSNPSNNVQWDTITVRCWDSANDADGKDDNTGLFPAWITHESVADARMSYKPGSAADTASRSDVRYVERWYTWRCTWFDDDGAVDLDTDPNAPGYGWISAAESRADPDMPAGIDDDGDCLADPAFAQPGRPVDADDSPNGVLCPAIELNEGSTAPSAQKIQFDTAADMDCDGLPDGLEVAWGSNPLLADSDGDGASDYLELFQFSNPLNPDTDGDGLLDKPEDDYAAAPLGGAANSVPEARVAGNCADGIDNDTDGRTDAADPGCDATDSDSDGASDADERALDSNPYNAASKPEAWIAGTCADGIDNDLDGKKDAAPPADPGCKATDTDGDGKTDVDEVGLGSIYLNEAGEAADSDDNCPLIFNPDQANNEGRGRPNGPFLAGGVSSNPTADTQGDACDQDDDNDAIVDVAEATVSTDPYVADTDGDRCVDGVESILGTDPANSGSKCPATLSESAQSTFRLCHLNLPGSAWSDFSPGYSGNQYVEMDPDGDGINCPRVSTPPPGSGDKDSDNGASAYAGPSCPPTCNTEVEDTVEIKGYYTGGAVPDSDGEACEDWIEIADINGDRVASPLDRTAVLQRVNNLVPADPVSDAIFDVNKDGVLTALDGTFVGLNSSATKSPASCLPLTSDLHRSLE